MAINFGGGVPINNLFTPQGSFNCSAHFRPEQRPADAGPSGDHSGSVDDAGRLGRHCIGWF